MTSPLPGRQTGRFSYDVRTGKWDWDDEVFRIHGYEPGSVEPTTELVLDSKHPEDRGRVEEVLQRIGDTGGRFSICYRVIGGDGVQRHVVLVGESAMCDPGDVTTIDGFYVDLSEDFSDESEDYARAAVEASAESRATIEQAKGVVMLVYSLDSDQAFAMLRWWSRNRNIKLRDLAARLVELARDGQITDADLRGQTDALLHDIAERGPDSSRA